MVFYDSSTSLGIVDEINSLCDTDNTSYTLANKTRRINNAYEQVVSWIINADGTWNFDDDNYTTIPEGTTTMVEGQSDYSFAATFLELNWVKVLDHGGNWQLLPPLDQSQLDIPFEDFLKTNGMPQFYDKLGSVIRLYPAPSNAATTLTAGLKVAFNRTASLFTASDTTKAPGFASPFHIILAYMASIPYCEAYKKDRVPLYTQKVQELKTDLINFYGHRERDKRKIITPNTPSFR